MPVTAAGDVRGEEAVGVVFNVQRFCLHDGPGIRTTVFLKGCPLRCQWCDNPESSSGLPEIAFARDACNKCGKCFKVCPELAIAPDDEGIPRIDRERCTACGKCVTPCIREALTVYGKSRTAAEVFEEVKRDATFYGSDGGVTVSGGEALRQPQFVVALFRLCRGAGISTCVETSGYAEPEALKSVLEITDNVLYDLKWIDPEAHRRFTGVSNHLILRNAQKVVKSSTKVQFRMPLIPGVNSGQENLQAMAQFLKELQDKDACIELMPYHSLGLGKYKALDRTYPLAGLKSPEPQFVEECRLNFEKLGVRCLVSR